MRLMGKEVPAGVVLTGDTLDLQLGSRKSGGGEGHDGDENARREHFGRFEVVLGESLRAMFFHKEGLSSVVILTEVRWMLKS